MNLQILHDAAIAAAKNATIQHLTKHGEDLYCGFAWVQVSEKASTKLGRALKSIGFTQNQRQPEGGGLQLWNPSGTTSQSMMLKEVGAQAYADVLQDFGIHAYIQSRADESRPRA